MPSGPAAPDRRFPRRLRFHLFFSARRRAAVPFPLPGPQPGGQAELPDDYDYSSVPSGSNILGAAKLSGKIGSWSLGTLSAVTSRERARFSLGSQRWQQEVEPLTYYGVYRAQKELHAGRHGLGFIGTLTARSFDGNGPIYNPSVRRRGRP